MASITLPASHPAMQKRRRDSDDDEEEERQARDSDYEHDDARVDDDEEEEERPRRRRRRRNDAPDPYVRHDAAAEKMVCKGTDAYSARMIQPGPLTGYFHRQTGEQGQQVAYRELFSNGSDHAFVANGRTHAGLQLVQHVCAMPVSARKSVPASTLSHVNAQQRVYSRVQWAPCRLLGLAGQFTHAAHDLVHRHHGRERAARHTHAVHAWVLRHHGRERAERH